MDVDMIGLMMDANFSILLLDFIVRKRKVLVVIVHRAHTFVNSEARLLLTFGRTYLTIPTEYTESRALLCILL
eukprot:scaffold7925_cov272-Chaetoceros_neogracile.AAC.8